MKLLQHTRRSRGAETCSIGFRANGPQFLVVPLRFATALTAAVGTMLSMAAWADSTSPTPAAQADTALHLLESGRYGEAIPAAQALVDSAPDDPLVYQVRGTLEMYVGGISAARQDFKMAGGLLHDSPVTLYGQGLVQIWTRHWDEAQRSLSLAGPSPSLSAVQKSDIATIQAYLAFLRGDMVTAASLPEQPPAGTDPVRQELAALVAARTSPSDGEARLSEFLRTPSGVPRVREEEGLRPLFDPAVGLEAAVTEPSLSRLYAASLSESRARSDRQARSAGRMGGAVTLRGPIGLSGAAAVTFTVDGHLAGMVNSPPYAFVWQTDGGGNGRHTIRTEAVDAGGNVLSSTTRLVSVFNAQPGHSGPGLAADAALEERVWNLLRLRPARKVAEWTLAGLLAQKGDAAGAQAHRLVAAALDADYKDGRRTARALLRTPGGGSAGLRTGSPARKQVALTFDDGPNPQHTPALLDALDKARVPATFFVVGSRAEAAPDLVRRMAAHGDDVEDHSYTHPNMALSAAPIAEAEILRTSIVIHALAGKQPRFFRPPGGQRNPTVYRLASEYGQTVALWTIDALPYEEAGSPQHLIAFIMKHMQPGAIVLMHNGMDSTTAAIPGLVAALRARGYEPVTLTAMAAGTPVAKAAGVHPPRPALKRSEAASAGLPACPGCLR